MVCQAKAYSADNRQSAFARGFRLRLITTRRVGATSGTTGSNPHAETACQNARSNSTSRGMGLILLIILILLLLGAFPTRGYGYGYGSHGVLGTILIIVLILWLLGRL